MILKIIKAANNAGKTFKLNTFKDAYFSLEGCLITAFADFLFNFVMLHSYSFDEVKGGTVEEFIYFRPIFGFQLLYIIGNICFLRAFLH